MDICIVLCPYDDSLIRPCGCSIHAYLYQKTKGLDRNARFATAAPLVGQLDNHTPDRAPPGKEIKRVWSSLGLPAILMLRDSVKGDIQRYQA